MELDAPAPVLTTRGWNLNALVSTHSNFRHVLRVHASAPPGELLTAIEEHEHTGVPLVIAGLQTLDSWPADKFSLETLQRYPEHETISVRDVHSREDLQIPLPEFLDELKATPSYTQPGEARRLYGKDYPCPREWLDWLERRSRIPNVLRPNGTNNALRNLPDPSDVETLMCYIGVGDTFTPSHKDMCASSGQNLMCYTSDDNSSSYWFMTASASTPEVAAYFHSLDSELALESRVLSVNEYANAPFDVYVIEQKVGDLVLVPPRSCHQVVNNGGITAKLSWSRMTVPGLVAAYYHELPLYHRVCRPETYRVKATIYHSLVHLTEQMETDFTTRQPPVTLSPSRLPHKPISTAQSGQSNAAINDLASLINVFDSILAEEYHPSHASLTHVQVESADSEWGSNTLLTSTDDRNAAAVNKNWHCTCDFCGADIFQSLFECQTCALDETNSGPASGFLLCPMCYVEGRSCKCGSMEPIQVTSFDLLLKNRNRAASALQKNGKNYVVIDYASLPISNCALLVFKAAVVLHHLQQEDQNMAAKGKKFTRTCTTRMKHEPAHQVARANVINCQGCHAFKCFKHILQMHGIHAAEALLVAADDDKKCTVWHARHLGVTQDAITNDIGRAVMAERRGVPPIATDRLLKAARQCGTCRPLNPEHVTLGWYDNAPSANETNAPPTSTATTTAVPPTAALAVLGPSETEAPITPQGTPKPTSGAPPLFLNSSPERPRDSPISKSEERSDTPPVSPTPRTPGAEPGSQLMDCVLVPRRSSITKKRRERSADPSIATLDTSVISLKADKSRRSSGVLFASPSAKRRKPDPPLPSTSSGSVGQDVGTSPFGKSAPSSAPVTRNQRRLSDPKEDPEAAHEKRSIGEASSNSPSNSATSAPPAEDTIRDNLASRLPGQSAVQANRLQKSPYEPARTDHQRPKSANDIVRISTAASVVGWPRDRVKRARPNLPDVFKQAEEQPIPGRPSTSQVLKTIKIHKKPSEPPATQVALSGQHHVLANMERQSFLHDPLAAEQSAPRIVTTSPSRAAPGTSSIFPATRTYAPPSSYTSNTRPTGPVDPRQRPSAPTNSYIPYEITMSQPPLRLAPLAAPSLTTRPAATTFPTPALPPPAIIPTPMPVSTPPQPPQHTPSQADYLSLQTENLMLRLKLQEEERLRQAQVKDGVKEVLQEILPGVLREAQAASGQRLLLDGRRREDRRDADRDYGRRRDDQRYTDRRNCSSERRGYGDDRGGYEDGRRNEDSDLRGYADDRGRHGYDGERDHRSNYNDRDRREHNDGRGYHNSSTYHFDAHPPRPEPSSWDRPRDDPPYEDMRGAYHTGSGYWDRPEDRGSAVRQDEYERNRGSGSYSNVPVFPPRPELADRIDSSPSRAEKRKKGVGRGKRGRGGGIGGNSYRETDSHRFEEIPDDELRASGSSQPKPGPSRW